MHLHRNRICILGIHLQLLLISFVILNERQKMRYLHHDSNRYIHKKQNEKNPAKIKHVKKKINKLSSLPL